MASGLKAEWANLPKRKCDNCGASYKPARPIVTGQRGFCSPNCRKEYHKHGGAYSKLKPFIEKEISRRVKKEVEKQCATIRDAIQEIRTDLLEVASTQAVQ